MIVVTCPCCGKPRLWGKDCGWCEKGKGMVGGQDGAASSADKEKDQASEAAEIVAEGEEYSTPKDHFKKVKAFIKQANEIEYGDKREETGDGE